MDIKPSEVLANYSIRDTHPRRAVLDVLMNSKKPLTHKEIHSQIDGVDMVTVYRVLDKFAEIGLTHTVAHSSGVMLCTVGDSSHHHVMLNCQDCGQVEECSDADLCKQEQRTAARNGFTVTKHVSEVVGVCSNCS